jgi:hypothetical protein
MVFKRWMLLGTLLLGLQAYGNPVALHPISELHFGPQGWILELDLRHWSGFGFGSDSCFLAAGSDTARILARLDVAAGGYLVLTADSLDHPLRIRSSGDTLVFFINRLFPLDFFTFAEDPGMCSLCRLWNGPIYLDATPTLGRENDADGAMGWIAGTVTDAEGVPIPGARIGWEYPFGTLHSAWTDSLGRYSIEAWAGPFWYWFEKEGFEIFYTEIYTHPDSTAVFDAVLQRKQAVRRDNPDSPLRFGLTGNYPNPFNAVTRFKYSIPEDGFTDLAVFDLGGRRIETLHRGFQKKGEYVSFWNAFEMPSGVYFCRLQIGNQVRVKKWVCIR